MYKKRKKRNFQRNAQAPVSLETFDLLTEIAFEMRLKRTDVIRLAIDQFIERYADEQARKAADTE
jgi:hypothetical protein